MEIDPKPLIEANTFVSPDQSDVPPIYVVSGSMGNLGEQVARTVLPQFQSIMVPVEIVPRVHHLDQIETVVKQAKQTNGTILHTLANPDLRQAIIEMAHQEGVVAIDIVGPLIERLTQVLNVEPVGKPGLYRELNESYFKRIEAIEYTLAHDDGFHPAGWKDAEIMLVGVSRVGKTPLSLYLSMLGWKVANLPLLPGVPPSKELFELDPRRVIGLKIDPMDLLTHRKHRQRGLGTGIRSDYIDPDKLYEEAKEATRIFRRGNFKVINVTNKPIETTAGQIILTITKQFK